MGLGFLCGVAFCFLGVGLMDAEVTQTPRYLVKRKGERVLMECFQDMNHDRMFWYRQDPGLGLRLLHFSYGVNNNDRGDFPDGYNVSREEEKGFSLILPSASTDQTSVYLCASSKSTALHSHILSAQKGQVPEGSDPNSGLNDAGFSGMFVPLRKKVALSATKPWTRTLARRLQALFHAPLNIVSKLGPFRS